MNVTLRLDANDTPEIAARFVWTVQEAGLVKYRQERMRVIFGDLELSLTINQAVALADAVLDAAHERRAEIAALNDRVSRPQGSEVMEASNG
jgi:hypothetical protein